MQTTFTHGVKDKFYLSIDPVSGLIDMYFLFPIENPRLGFKALHDAIDNFFSNNKNSIITVNAKVKFFNSGSTSEILKIFRKFQKYNKEIKFIINWYYLDDYEESLILGKEIEFICDLKFNFIPYQE